LAERLLCSALEKPSHPASFHVWLPLPEAEAEQVAARALRQRVVLTPPSASLVDTQLISGIRLCLGTAPNRPTLQRALDVVATLLSSNIDDRSRSVV
jgi:DNA-binding transcriptional MocR family regulator